MPSLTAHGQIMEGVEIGGGPIHVTSERLEAAHKDRKITFVGDVVARQKDLTLYSDTLDLFLQDENEELERIVAEGNVRMVQGDRRATCRKATYLHREGKLVLDGDPVIRQGENHVKGWRIIYFVNEKRSIVEGQADERVTVTIVPGDTQEAK
jgi:lipopolysaccharide export system protein LptA